MHSSRQQRAAPASDDNNTRLPHRPPAMSHTLFTRSAAISKHCDCKPCTELTATCLRMGRVTKKQQPIHASPSTRRLFRAVSGVGTDAQRYCGGRHDEVRGFTSPTTRQCRRPVPGIRPYRPPNWSLRNRHGGLRLHRNSPNEE